MSSEGRGLSKWQVAALGVGAAAIVAGGAIVAYACVKRRSSRRQKRSDPTPQATPQTQSTGEGSGAGGQSETPAASQPASEQLVRTVLELNGVGFAIISVFYSFAGLVRNNWNRKAILYVKPIIRNCTVLCILCCLMY